MRSESWLRLMSGLVLVGIFAAGTLFGAGLMRFAAPTAPAPPPLPPGGPIEAIKRELALDADQIAALEMIADAHHRELEAIGRETQGKAGRVLNAIEDELVPRLRPDQVERLVQWRKTRRPPPGHRGPPRPPREALAACEGAAANAACAFDIDGHHLDGTCQPVGEALACAPNNPPPGRPMGPPPGRP